MHAGVPITKGESEPKEYRLLCNPTLVRLVCGLVD